MKKLGVVLHESADYVVVKKTARTTIYKGSESTIKGVEFKLKKKSSLVYYEWPPEVAKPSFDSDAEYHKINILGAKKQPRKTINYGVAYTYSGVKHTLDKNCPRDVQAVMAYTESMYSEVLGDEKTDTMCLANRYETGFHCIGRHSDSEGQLSTSVRDVVCWVVNATRRLIIRNIDKKDSTIILSVSLPEGIYIMKGDRFQSTYTHEIPREQTALFNKLCLKHAQTMDKYFAKHINRYTSLDEQMEWLCNHRKLVKSQCPESYRAYKQWADRYSNNKKLTSQDKTLVNFLIHDGPTVSGSYCLSSYMVNTSIIDKLDRADWLAVNSKIVKKNSPELYLKYKDWNRERCSYTIRFFSKDS
jgi:hypothetical protein